MRFSLKRVLLSLFVLVIAILPMLFAVAGAAPENKPVQKYSKNSISIKLKKTSLVSYDGTKFVGAPEQEVSVLNNILDSAKKVKANKLITQAPKDTTQAKIKTKLDSYYTVVFAKDVDTVSISNQLKAISVVDTAYARPTPAPAPSANYKSLQTYLKAAPRGVNATFAAGFPGGGGNSTKIVDIEYSWNTGHEDLSKARTALYPNGTPVDPFNDNNHGTAVLGEMIADENGFGVTGVTPKASLELINAYNSERGYDLTNALYAAAFRTEPGDVILVEQQTWGPTPDTYDFVPVEFVPEYYDVIKALTDAGRIVIEPAGNGGQNLDDTSYYGTSFPMGKPDSGAIIVGAADNCDGSTTLRSRLGLSTYGTRLNLQGPGNCVTTTGYGWLAGTTPNDFYTSGFNGTSSASPVVASAAASLSSAYELLNGTALSPQQTRTILMQTGTNQNTGAGTLLGNIGKYPNLAKALLKADITSPSVPTAFAVSLNALKQPYLSWGKSTDNYKIKNYQIYRNGTLYKTVTKLNLTDTAVVSGNTYSYKVRASDPSGNLSGFTSTISATIP